MAIVVAHSPGALTQPQTTMYTSSPTQIGAPVFGAEKNERCLAVQVGKVFVALALSVLVSDPPPARGQRTPRKKSSLRTQTAGAPGQKPEKVSATAATAANWMAATPYSGPILRYGFAQNGEDFYVISGNGSGSATAAVRRYNVATDTWTSLANIPLPSIGPLATYYDGKIYVLSGQEGNFDPLQIYDIASNTWSNGLARPSKPDSTGGAMGAYDGKVYVVAGSFVNNDLAIYDIATNTWSVGPSAPADFASGGYAQIGQYLYLIGGRGASSDVNSTVSMRLDMATNTWSTGPNFTPQRKQFALAAAGTKLFAIGGDTNGSTLEASAEVDEVETSNWPAGTWAVSPNDLPSPRFDNSAGFASHGRTGTEIWTTGGSPVPAPNEHLFRSLLGPCPNYSITQSVRFLTGGTTDIGNHCLTCVTPIALPFPFTLNGVTYMNASASSNGTLQFVGTDPSSANSDLPAAGFNATIFPFWDDLRTDLAGGGIFTAVQGSAPNRTFHIEWRAFSGDGTTSTNFEVLLFEGLSDFEIVYNNTVPGNNFSGTIGVQITNYVFKQYAGPNAALPPKGTRLLFTTGCCAPIAFHGAIGENSDTYPGESGTQMGAMMRNGTRSECGIEKTFPGFGDTSDRDYDVYSFTNSSGGVACVTFDVNTTCVSPATQIFPAVYLESFDPMDIAMNYFGDPGISPTPFGSFSVKVSPNSTVLLVVAEVVGVNCDFYDVVVRGLNCPPIALISAASRKTHGGTDFDVPLPLTGEPGVECRSNGGGHSLATTFNYNVTSGDATVTGGTGTAGTPTFSGATMLVPLSGVADLQKLTVTLSGVTSSTGLMLDDTDVSMNVLLGDVTGNKVVNATDISFTKLQSGTVAGESNFRTDVTLNGSVNATDVSTVKLRSGSGLP